MEQKPFEAWAIVEIFGHIRLAGLVSEASIGGCSFVRVDVPGNEDSKRQGFTRFYGQGAIYSMTIVDEPVARAAVEEMQPRAVSIYSLPQLQASYASEYEDYDEDD